MAMIVKTGQPRLAKDVCRLLEDPSLGLCSLLEIGDDESKEKKQHEDFGLRCTIECGGANEPIQLVFLFPKGTFEHKMVRQPPKATLVAMLRKKLPSASISVDGRCIGGTLSIEIPRARPSFVKISRSLMDTDLLATMMSQVRVYTLGLPIMIEFQKLLCNNGIVEDGSPDDQYLSMPLEIHKTYERSNNGFSLLEISNQKLVISFKVDVADEIERALARVLLQAVAGTKTNTRLCEYRKDWKTVEAAMRKAGGGNHYSLEGDHDHCAGYIVFTFFAAHAQQLSECDSLVPSCANLLEEMVFSLVNFQVYLHSQIKSSKTFMRRRMREKKDLLMKPLVMKGLRTTVFGTVASPGRHGPQRSPSRLSIGSPGRRGTSASPGRRGTSNIIGSPGPRGSIVSDLGSTAFGSPGPRGSTAFGSPGPRSSTAFGSPGSIGSPGRPPRASTAIGSPGPRANTAIGSSGPRGSTVIGSPVHRGSTTIGPPVHRGNIGFPDLGGSVGSPDLGGSVGSPGPRNSIGEPQRSPGHLSIGSAGPTGSSNIGSPPRRPRGIFGRWFPSIST